ncbi:hypothetical protein scyTo_0007747 [Scyliorhinus torazame]|uniref:Ig-like domain-containing protein n=1 Tax=Scyliorhinus torazame TaxID=75743 RepID=A0A401NXH0_SCYTO|nr:hypothetical protein [Scyliorhinus torazame]
MWAWGSVTCHITLLSCCTDLEDCASSQFRRGGFPLNPSLAYSMGRCCSSAQVMVKASCAVLHLLLWSMIHDCCTRNSIHAAELVFTSSPSDMVALTKRPLNISCVAVEKDHRSSAFITWFLNLEDPIPGLNVWVYQSHAGFLFFPSLREEDLGKYTCKATLGLSSIKTTFNIYKAYTEPMFYGPISQSVNAGESVFFHCVSGDSRPLVDIRWIKDRRIVSEGCQFQGQYGDKNSLKVSGTLHIANVSKEDEGKYVCVTHNSLLDVSVYSTAATLKIKALMSKLFIAKDPENVTVAVGRTASMHCTIQGFPQPDITWYKNNKLLNDTRAVKHDGNRGILMLRNVSLEDEGFYHCEGSNGNEIVISQAAYLLPAAMGWEFIREPCNVTVRRGDATTLHCSPPFSNPPARVSWFKNNHLLISQANSHLLPKENDDLTFSSVQESDDGDYFCRASNPYLCRTVTSRHINLNVLVNKVLLGSGVTLYCQAEGNPAPSVVWYKGDLPIIVGRRIFLGFQNRTLRISPVVKSDEDLYVCEATNLVGCSNQSTVLSVAVTPIIVSFTKDLTVANGSSAALTCSAIGDGVIVYSWYKNGHLIKNSEPNYWNKGQEMLLIPRVNLTDEGTYRCVASSTLGRDERTGRLRVHVPPSIRFLNTSMQVRHGVEFTLFCVASGIPKPSIIWSFRNRPITLSDRQRFLTEDRMLTIRKAMQSVEGIYECEAVNEAGSAKRSVTVHINGYFSDIASERLSFAADQRSVSMG